MLAVSNSFKNAYNQYTTQRKSYIKVGNNEYFIQNLDLYADAYDEGNIVGNAIAKTLKFDIETQYVRGLDEFELFDGIFTGEEYEYVSLGTFKLFEEQGADDFFSHITAYDKLILFNKPYDASMTDYPTTVYGLLENLCVQAGVELGVDEIANGTQPLESNLFVEGETLKDILKAICAISGTFALISEDTLKLKLVGEDSLTLSNYQVSEPEYKRTTWKINQVVLAMKDVDGEYVQKQDDEDIEENGVHKIVINDNPFTFSQDLREAYIDELYDALYGFGYIAFETKWEGLPYVELGDTLTIDGKESIVLRYQIKSPDGLNSMLQAPSIIDSVIDYIDNTSDIQNKLRRTELKVDKANGEIEAIAHTTTEIGNELSNNHYTIEETNQLILNSSEGLTNTFSEAGGNNIFRNTGLWFSASSTEATLFPYNALYPSDGLFSGNKVLYEYWNGTLEKTKEEDAINSVGILLQNDELYQEQTVPNGNYTVSFKYKKLYSLVNVSVQINGFNYDLTEENGEFVQTVDVTGMKIGVLFKCDIDNGCEIYDLMVNAGTVKLAYSQNQNETTTDTVKISKGITITSTDTDTTFKANADGIRTLDNRGNVLTQFTDVGMTTKKQIVENEAEIVGVLIKEVGRQTWFIKL